MLEQAMDPKDRQRVRKQRWRATHKAEIRLYNRRYNEAHNPRPPRETPDAARFPRAVESGHYGQGAKLTPEQVRDLRARYAEGAELDELYALVATTGITRSGMRQAIYGEYADANIPSVGKAWDWLEDDPNWLANLRQARQEALSHMRAAREQAKRDKQAARARVGQELADAIAAHKAVGGPVWTLHVLRLMRRCKDGGWSMPDIGAICGVSKARVWQLLSGLSELEERARRMALLEAEQDLVAAQQHIRRCHFPIVLADEVIEMLFAAAPVYPTHLYRS